MFLRLKRGPLETKTLGNPCQESAGKGNILILCMN